MRNVVSRLLGRLRARSHRARQTFQSTLEPGFVQTRRLEAEPWYIDSVETPAVSGQVRLRGWALADPDAPQADWANRFLVNGKSPTVVTYPLDRPDVQEVFPQRRGAAASGFMLLADEHYPGGVMQVTCLDTACTALDAGRQHWHLPDPALHATLPDADRRFRVIGNRDADGFLRLGATDALKIKAAYEAVSGKRWDHLGPVLDWGVGCGRVARHLAPGLGERFHGCDIDADNVAWCASNLQGAYSASRLAAALPYADNSFDLVYGVSVFTHLRAEWELKWLAELHRVLRHGGMMLVTVHGQTAVDFARLDASTYRALQQRMEVEGLVVTSTNNQLEGFVEHPQEYVNVFHSRAHIQAVWGKWFQNIVQLPGYIFTHDLVVARKQPA